MKKVEILNIRGIKLFLLVFVFFVRSPMLFGGLVVENLYSAASVPLICTGNHPASV